MTDKPDIPDIAAATVAHNGDLRDHIVAALALADQDWCSDRPLYEDMADAVIEALGLKQQDRYGFHRCVSEWKPDD